MIANSDLAKKLTNKTDHITCAKQHQSFLKTVNTLYACLLLCELVLGSVSQLCGRNLPCNCGFLFVKQIIQIEYVVADAHRLLVSVARLAAVVHCSVEEPVVRSDPQDQWLNFRSVLGHAD